MALTRDRPALTAKSLFQRRAVLPLLLFSRAVKDFGEKKGPYRRGYGPMGRGELKSKLRWRPGDRPYFVTTVMVTRMRVSLKAGSPEITRALISE